MEDVQCPFCKEHGFDLVGLKHHYQMGYCATYEITMTIEEERGLIISEALRDRAANE